MVAPLVEKGLLKLDQVPNGSLFSTLRKQTKLTDKEIIQWALDGMARPGMPHYDNWLAAYKVIAPDVPLMQPPDPPSGVYVVAPPPRPL